MSESASNYGFFGSADNDDQLLAKALKEIKADYKTEDPSVSFDQQLLRDTFYSAETYDMYSPDVTEANWIFVKTSKDEYLVYKPLIAVQEGLIAQKPNNKLVLLRGTAYSQSPETLNDKYAQAVFFKQFKGSAYPTTIKESTSLTVPLLAAIGQFGQFGYLITSQIYTFADITILNSRGEEPNANTFATYNGIVDNAPVTLFISDIPEPIPNTIQSITLVPKE